MDLPKFHALLADKFHLGDGWVTDILFSSSKTWNMYWWLETGNWTVLIRAELKYGLVGLHTCGDLGPTILHLFHQVGHRIWGRHDLFSMLQDSGAGAVVSVGCCYMRLKEHYPMSRWFLETVQMLGKQQNGKDMSFRVCNWNWLFCLQKYLIFYCWQSLNIFP